jgi:hypothetical protein
MNKQTTITESLAYQITGLLGLVDRYRELAAAADDPAQRAGWLRVADEIMERARALSEQATESRH